MRFFRLRVAAVGQHLVYLCVIYTNSTCTSNKQSIIPDPLVGLPNKGYTRAAKKAFESQVFGRLKRFL